MFFLIIIRISILNKNNDKSPNSCDIFVSNLVSLKALTANKVILSPSVCNINEYMCKGVKV